MHLRTASRTPHGQRLLISTTQATSQLTLFVLALATGNSISISHRHISNNREALLESRLPSRQTLVQHGLNTTAQPTTFLEGRLLYLLMVIPSSGEHPRTASKSRNTPMHLPLFLRCQPMLSSLPTRRTTASSTVLLGRRSTFLRTAERPSLSRPPLDPPRHPPRLSFTRASLVMFGCRRTRASSTRQIPERASQPFLVSLKPGVLH